MTGNTGEDGDLIDYWELPGGVEFSNDDVDKFQISRVLEITPGDSRMKDAITDSDGELVLGPSGKPLVSAARVMVDDDGNVVGEWPEEVFKGQGLVKSRSVFPDGTEYYNKSGKPPEWLKNAPIRQADTNLINTVDPRAPWENIEGHWIGDKEFWRAGKDDKNIGDWADTMLERSTFKETIPFTYDALATSAPYFIPRYNLAAGVARALPYAYGYDGQSYAPTGRNLLDVGSFGEGKYSDEPTTRAQRIGGFIAPLVDAYAERMFGPAVGGLDDLLIKKGLVTPKVAKLMRGSMGARMLTSGASEGLEEMLATFPQKLEQEGWQDFGHEYYYDDLTGEKIVDYSTPWGGSFGRDLGSDFLAGGHIGGTLTGMGNIFAPVVGAIGGGKGRRGGGSGTKTPDLPATLQVPVSRRGHPWAYESDYSDLNSKNIEE